MDVDTVTVDCVADAAVDAFSLAELVDALETCWELDIYSVDDFLLHTGILVEAVVGYEEYDSS